MRISDIDSNFKIETSIKRDGLVYRSIDVEPFKVYGVWHDGECYRRLPAEVASGTIDGNVGVLARNTAGGRVRFVTDSPYVAVKVISPAREAVPHMTYTATAGLDMYVNFGEGERYAKTFSPPMNFSDGFDGVYDFSGDFAAMRTVTINMPLYNDVNKMYVGLKEGSTLLPPPDYAVEPPVVYYGSSITQGGCASRPGMCYENIIARELGTNYVNLGFSGSAKGETVLAEYISSLKMSAFVYDYDHNATTPEDLERTHKPFFDIIRAAQPTLPIIIMPKPRYYRYEIEQRRSGIVRATYEAALAAGDENVYFIDGPELMSDVLDGGTVDGVYPTDLGFMSMARAIIPVLKKALGK
ncbi:MAG: hypothetical protein IKA64_00165 [Clostridia bacterium]|nr:hypothetical protein [Clostridia bacterium]